MTLNNQKALAVAAACRALRQSQDLQTVLTSLKDDCIADLTRTGAPDEAVLDAHRRYHVVDDIQNRIDTYGRSTTR